MHKASRNEGRISSDLANWRSTRPSLNSSKFPVGEEKEFLKDRSMRELSGMDKKTRTRIGRFERKNFW